MPRHPAFTVPPARGGEISDRSLDAIIDATERMTSGQGYSAADGALVLMTIAPLLGELRDWRKKAGVIRELALPDNVIMLRGVA